MENENKSDSFEIHEPETVCEAAFQAGWNELADGVVLTGSDGMRIQILSRGEWNHEAGPDFRNAKIRRNGKILCGDVELHRKSSDYIRHGHLADPAYDKVILHVVEEDDLAGRSEGSALAHIPLCRISFAALKHRSGAVCRCRIFPYMCTAQLRSFFTDAGLERIQAKSAVVLENMIQSGSGPAFRRVLFRAAGYKSNQEAFLELLRRLELYSPDVLKTHFEALIWGESTLLPDPADPELPEEIRRQVRLLWDEFWSYRLKAGEPIRWKRDSVRPLNSPERRIAMLAEFYRKFSFDPLPVWAAELNRMDSGKFLRLLRKKLNLSHSFWDSHSSFYSRSLPRKAAVLGADRAETLLIDGFAPALLAYAKLYGGKLSESKAAGLPLLIRPQKGNRIIRNALSRWFPDPETGNAVLDNAAAVQGCLHVYKLYCSAAAGDCVSCLLANSPV